MNERQILYDKILRNKTVVKRIQNSGITPARLELAIINYYSYKDIGDKLNLLYEIKELPVDDSIQFDSSNTEIDDMISVYKSGLDRLSNNDNLFILSHVDNLRNIDKYMFDDTGFDNILIYDDLESLLNYTYYSDLFTVHVISKNDDNKRFIMRYGRMEDDKLHIYQITPLNPPKYEFRADYIPYENESKLGYYLPFMDKPEYIGIGNDIGPDDNNVWYGFIDNQTTNKTVDISYLAFK